MSSDLAQVVADFRGRGYVIAPAGYGKTHLIAEATLASSGRQLVLTHTFAGVTSLANKMKLLAVPSANVQTDTIASWALKLCSAYPKAAKWSQPYPEGSDWGALYQSCADLLHRPFIGEIILASYSGLLVDEYQDCSRAQHALVCALAELLPCRIVGDPMQAIFDFGTTSGTSESLVNWKDEIFPHFECLGKLDIPHRWEKSGAIALGTWLKAVRCSFESGENVSLAGPIPVGVVHRAVALGDFAEKKRLRPLYEKLLTTDTVIALFPGDAQSKSKSHNLARAMAGRYSSIEEVEGKALLRFASKLDKARTHTARLVSAVAFLKQSCTGIDKVLPAPTKLGRHARLTSRTRDPKVAEAANAYLVNGQVGDLRNFLQAAVATSEAVPHRRDLFNRTITMLNLFEQKKFSSLVEACLSYQRSFRHAGRPIRHSKLIGTTLLVKGLEYDHAIVLEPENFDCHELYVALTRGTKSLTIVTAKDCIGPFIDRVKP